MRVTFLKHGWMSSVCICLCVCESVCICLCLCTLGMKDITHVMTSINMEGLYGLIADVTWKGVLDDRWARART